MVHSAVGNAKAFLAIREEFGTFSRDLKRRGMRFVGPTILDAFMQSVGTVNDHLLGCFRHRELKG